jgi:NADPH:quinone reductase-like Zn-dependent oxidoreductase
LAEELGIHTINLVRRQEQVEALKQETGAEHVLWCPSDGSLNPQLQSEILRITGSSRVKGAFDAVADGLSASLMLNVMSRYGTLVVYGILGNKGVELSFESSVRVVLEGMKVTGFSLQNWWLPDTPDEEKARVYNAVWKHIQNNPALNPQVESIYAFADVGKAIRSSLEQKTGKVLLCPRQEDATAA